MAPTSQLANVDSSAQGALVAILNARAKVDKTDTSVSTTSTRSTHTTTNKHSSTTTTPAIDNTPTSSLQLSASNTNSVIGTAPTSFPSSESSIGTTRSLTFKLLIGCLGGFGALVLLLLAYWCIWRPRQIRRRALREVGSGSYVATPQDETETTFEGRTPLDGQEMGKWSAFDPSPGSSGIWREKYSESFRQSYASLGPSRTSMGSEAGADSEERAFFVGNTPTSPMRDHARDGGRQDGRSSMRQSVNGDGTSPVAAARKRVFSEGSHIPLNSMTSSREAGNNNNAIEGPSSPARSRRQSLIGGRPMSDAFGDRPNSRKPSLDGLAGAPGSTNRKQNFPQAGRLMSEGSDTLLNNAKPNVERGRYMSGGSTTQPRSRSNSGSAGQVLSRSSSFLEDSSRYPVIRGPANSAVITGRRLSRGSDGGGGAEARPALDRRRSDSVN